MDGNLTLKINDSVLENAKNYASRKGMNLSVIVEDFLFRLTSGDKDEVQERKVVRQLPERFRSLKGVLAEVGKDDGEDVRLNYLLEKYK